MIPFPKSNQKRFPPLKFFRIEFSFFCFYKYRRQISADFPTLLPIYSPLSPCSTYIAAVGAFAVESANVVGYNTEATRAGYNYVIPAFRTVGGDKNATDIQLLQLSSNIGSYEVSFQFLTAKRRNAHTYNWISAEDAADYADNWPTGQGLWIDDETSSLPEETVTVGVGNAVQMDMGDYDAEELTCSGQVSDADLSYTTRAGYNYIGNPYPTALDIQNIQLSDAVASYEVSFQFLTAKRRNAHTYDWISAEDAADYADDWEKDLGLWIDDETSAFPEETVTIAPGGAIQLDMGDFNGEIVNVYAPIEL